MATENDTEDEIINIYNTKHKLLLYIRQLWNNDNFNELARVGTTCKSLTNILTSVSPTEKNEGFWFSVDKENILYPVPLPTNTPLSNNFLELLDIVTNYLNSIDSYTTNFNTSICRLSGMKVKGYRTYHLHLNGITYNFPEGLKHYYINFNVQPSIEFSMALRASLLKKVN